MLGIKNKEKRNYSHISKTYRNIRRK